ncbi:MAG: hypothetical protein JST54_07770 [Deltaproteobacteria bacterium]|nr:hypothetical protein [Deltaproteobacteria bacterium]
MVLVGVLLAATVAANNENNTNIGKPHIGEPQLAHKLADQVAVAPLKSASGSELVLDRPGKPLHIGLDEQTPVYANGERTSPHALQKGAQVRVSYNATDGQVRANWVEILTPAWRNE